MMNENTAKNLAVFSLILGCVVYLITMFAAIQMMSGIFGSFNFGDPEKMSTDFADSFTRYAETLTRFKWPIVFICSVGILTGILGLRAPKKQKGMAVAGIILGVIYLLSNLVMVGLYGTFLSNI